MARMTINISGAQELSDKLKHLEGSLPHVIEESVMAAAKVYRDGEKRRIRKHRLSGNTEDDIQIHSQNVTNTGFSAKVGTTKDGRAYIARFLEYGHDITIVVGKRLSAGIGKRQGRMVNATKIVGHVPAFPFIRPTLDEDTPEAIRAAIREVDVALKEAGL